MNEFSHLSSKKQPKSKFPLRNFNIPPNAIPGVFYIRVSTTNQEESGNGLDAQRHAILEFAKKHNIAQVGDFFEEIVSGGADISKRLVFQEALRLAGECNGYIVTSKLDRLSRDSALINNLIRDQYKFVVAEYGFSADNLQLRIIAAVGEKEREMIATRTRDAMAAIKRRYEDDYQRDLALLGPDKAVKKRLGIPNAKDCPTHYSKTLKAQGEKRRQYYMNEIFLPTLKLFPSRPSLPVFTKRINEEGHRALPDETLFTENLVKESLKKGFGLTYGQFARDNY